MSGRDEERPEPVDRPAARVLSAGRPPRVRLGTGVGCLVLLGVTLAAMAHVAVQARRLDVALALGEEQKEHAALPEQQRRLKNDLGRLEDPGLISAMARERLNMGPVDPTGIRIFKPTRTRERRR